MSLLATGCPEDSQGDGEVDADAGGSKKGSDAGPRRSNTKDGGGANDGGRANEGGSAADGGGASDGGGAVDAGDALDAGDAGNGGSAAGSGGSAAGSGGSAAGSGGSAGSGVKCDSEARHFSEELVSAFRRVNGTFCGRCSETDPNRSNCLEAPVSESRILCIRDAVCSSETLIDGARCMQGGLDTRNANCNFDGELSCDNGCWEHSAGDAHIKSCAADPTFGAALAKCGIDLTPSGL